MGSEALQKHWDETLTDRENYARMGVCKWVNGRVDPRSGRKRKREESQEREVIGEMSVVRDPVSGAILRIVSAEDKKRRKRGMTEAEKTWTARRVEVESDNEAEEAERIVGEGIRLADEFEKEAEIREKAPSAAKSRRLSPRDKDWCARMVAKHQVGGQSSTGEDDLDLDWEAMCRDRKMNVYQLTKGQMKRKIKQYLQDTGQLRAAG